MDGKKSEITEKLKDSIILNLFKCLKKPYESVSVERKTIIIECRVKTLFQKQPLNITAKYKCSQILYPQSRKKILRLTLHNRNNVNNSI